MWRLCTKSAESFFSGLKHCKYYCILEDKDGNVFVKSDRMTTSDASNALKKMLEEENCDSPSALVNIANEG